MFESVPFTRKRKCAASSATSAPEVVVQEDAEVVTRLHGHCVDAAVAVEVSGRHRGYVERLPPVESPRMCGTRAIPVASARTLFGMAHEPHLTPPLG